MRLDWFLPALRKTADGEPACQSRLGGLIRRVLPSWMVSDHQTKRRGAIRRTLRRCGPTWLFSPLRRLTQACCFVLFLWLFLYVCWPYTATPAPPSRVSDGWQLANVDQEDGLILMTHDDPPEWIAQSGAPIQLVDINDNEEGVGAFVVERRASTDTYAFTPDQLTPELLQRILLASGDWRVAERPADDWPTHYADDLQRKQFIPADIFLVIDPLVSLSTAIAARQWVWSLGCAAIILTVCLIVPRGFCGYLCPLGTLIDLFDWSIGSRIQRFRVAGDGWWVHIKYYLLLASLVSALFGVLITGYVAAIPVITRGFLFVLEPMASGLLRGWHLVPGPNLGMIVSIALFAVVLGLGLLRPRFWCKYVCPSGAVFSLGNLFRLTERKVESSCIHCNKCIEVCPFDAIKPDFTTRVTDCTQCQTCGGVCPTHAIKFVERGNTVELKVLNDPPTGETAVGRRGFISALAGTAAAIVGAISLVQATRSFGAGLPAASWRPVRPPGSVPETEFLQMCIRCGECFKACPNNVLQPLAFQQGIEGLWTPHVVADWAGCESSCNACGAVCPTGAIRELPMEEKRFARMGLAIVNESTCLPFANREACQLCVDECNAAGYEAIEFTRVHTESDEQGRPLPDTGHLAPVVLAEKCVGCGLCQTRCYGINVQERKLLDESAIIVLAGNGREDRMLRGSYAQLAQQRQTLSSSHDDATDFYVPPTDELERPESGDDPFGLQ